MSSASIPTVPGAATAASGGAQQPGGTAPTGGLGKDDFLKLLVGQLRNQDPLNPVEDQTFLAQMAAFSTLEQITNLGAATEQLGSSAAIDQSLALIDHEVTYLDADGNPVDGMVEKVSFEDGVPVLTIGGVAGILPGQVTEVR
jgi:flagellar basal-body rod modification protein FlgD